MLAKVVKKKWKNRSEKQRKIQQKSKENNEIMLRLSSKKEGGCFFEDTQKSTRSEDKTMRSEVKAEPKVMPKWMQNECKSEQQGDAEK